MNIALVAESQYDYLRIYLMLACEMNGDFRLRWIDQPANAVEALASEPFDWVLLYSRTYGVSATDTLSEIRAHNVEIPALIISKSMSVNFRAEAEGLGAVVLHKQNLTANLLLDSMREYHFATAY